MYLFSKCNIIIFDLSYGKYINVVHYQYLDLQFYNIFFVNVMFFFLNNLFANYHSFVFSNIFFKKHSQINIFIYKKKKITYTVKYFMLLSFQYIYERFFKSKHNMWFLYD